MKTVLNITLSLITLSICVAFHELGHLIVALYQGIPVETYSIGFGPSLVSTMWHGINWKISAIPIGGYCEFPDGVSPNWIVAIAGPLIGLVGTMPAMFTFSLLDGDTIRGWRLFALSVLTAICIPLTPILIPLLIIYGFKKTDSHKLPANTQVTKPKHESQEPIFSGPVHLVANQVRDFNNGDTLKTFFKQLTIISLSINLFNLLPIPPLDGGVALLDVIPMTSGSHDNLYKGFTIFFIAFFLAVTSSDIIRLVRGVFRKEA